MVGQEHTGQDDTGLLQSPGSSEALITNITAPLSLKIVPVMSVSTLDWEPVEDRNHGILSVFQDAWLTHAP